MVERWLRDWAQRAARRPKRIEFDPGLGQREFLGSVNAFLRNADESEWERERERTEGNGRLDDRPRYRLQIHCGWKEFHRFTRKKEQSPLLHHGFIFPRGPVDTVRPSHHADSESKTRRVRGFSGPIPEENPVTTWNAKLVHDMHLSIWTMWFERGCASLWKNCADRLYLLPRPI